MKKRVLDETGANGTAFLHKRIPCTNHAHQIIGAFKRLRWAYPDYAIPQGLETFESLLRRTGHIINFGDNRLESQPATPPQYANGLLNDTHLMFKHPPFLVDANKWCDNSVETRDVHAALKPLHSSLRRTQIVMSVSKLAWMRVRRMPSDSTRNHAWRVAHQISLHAQLTDRRKCGKRITVDHVHFECRYVKPLWSIFAQANGLTENALIPQSRKTFLEGALFHPRFRRRKDKWCNMAHSVVYYQAWVRWLLCNNIIPKAIPLSERLAHCPYLASHPNTKKLAELARIHRL